MIFCKLSIEAWIKYESEPIGTQITYRYGDDDKGVDVPLGVTEVEGVYDHADIGGILSRLAEVRNFDELEGCVVQVALELLEAGEIAVSLFQDYVTLEKKSLKNLGDREGRIAGVTGTDGDVLQVEKNGHGGVGSVLGCADDGSLGHEGGREQVVSGPGGPGPVALLALSRFLCLVVIDIEVVGADGLQSGLEAILECKGSCGV